MPGDGRFCCRVADAVTVQRRVDGKMRVIVLGPGPVKEAKDAASRAWDELRGALRAAGGVTFQGAFDAYIEGKGDRIRERTRTEYKYVLSAYMKDWAERTMAAIECSLIAMMKTISDSPHGAEILDMKNSLAGDLAAVWRTALSQSFGAAIADEARRNKVDLAARGLTAGALADLLLDGLEGMKSRVSAADEQREGARRLVAVISLALQR